MAGLCALAALGAAAAVRGRCVAAAVSEVDEVALGSATASARMAALAVSGEQMDVAALPGDPSLVLHTNVAIADKPALLKAASEAIAASLSKPESYVARSCSFDGGAGEGMYRSSRNVGGSVLGRTDEVFHDIRFLICSFLEKVS